MIPSELNTVNEQELWKNAILEQVSIEKINSTFPCNLAVDIPSAPRRRYSRSDGQKCSYIAFSNESHPKLNAMVMAPIETKDSSYLRNHANYMPSRFTKGVLEPPNVSYKYVPIDHPIISMINDFSKELQLSLTQKDMVDGQFFKVDSAVLDEAKELMLPRIESMFPQSNLGEFSVNFSRADGKPFDDPHGILCNVTSEEAKHKIMHQKRSIDMVLDVNYSFVPESTH